MHETEAQLRVVQHLSGEYGQPDRMLCERTTNRQGLIWLRWHAAPRSLGDRNLFIRPDGSRLSWELK